MHKCDNYERAKNQETPGNSVLEPFETEDPETAAQWEQCAPTIVGGAKGKWTGSNIALFYSL